MRNSLLCALLMVFTLSGCAVITDFSSLEKNAPGAQVSPASLVSVGMTRQEVVRLMSAPVTVGYEIDPQSGASKPIQVQNLYSSEMIEAGGISHQLDYYLLRAPQRGGKPAKDDLLPLVYKNGILAGKGYEDLDAITKARVEK